MKTHKHLRLARMRLGLSQEEVGKHLGVSRQSVSKYERGPDKDGGYPKQGHWEKYEHILNKPRGWIWSLVMKDRADTDGIDSSEYPIPATNDEMDTPLSPEIYELALMLQQYANPALMHNIRKQLNKLRTALE